MRRPSSHAHLGVLAHVIVGASFGALIHAGSVWAVFGVVGVVMVLGLARSFHAYDAGRADLLAEQRAAGIEDAYAVSQLRGGFRSVTPVDPDDDGEAA